MQDERKRRANRLIQKGALLEQYFQSYHLDIEQTEELLKIFSDYINANKPDHLKEKDDSNG